jgi:hypothetical protein
MLPNLFAICNQQEWTVDKVLKEGEINLTFRRSFRDREEIDWEDLRKLVEGVSI